MAVKRKKFVFNGFDSETFGLYLTGTETFDSTSKRQTKYHIPGRNGDLIVSDDDYENVTYKLKVGLIGDDASQLKDITHTLHSKVRQLRSVLLSSKGYCKLSDDYHPDEYRMAQFVGNISFDVTNYQHAEATLEFDCKPQHFLTVGLNKYDFTSNGILQNFTYFSSKPLIRIYGKGKVEVGDGIINIAEEGTSYIDIDCESEDVYEGATNRNENVEISYQGISHLFPKLDPGKNVINLGDGITKIVIQPRYWML